MIAVQTDFATRASEVACYFQFLREFYDKKVAFSADTRVDQDVLFKTLKANGFLLLYNLVESTVKNALEAIFDEFKGQNVSFDSCRDEVRKIVLSNLKRHNVDGLLPKLLAISVDVVVTTFRKEDLFSGNVDGRRIREVAKEYGFLHPASSSKELLTVKSNRNDLAHGIKSFADVGRDYDIDRLEEIKTAVVAFLTELLNNIAMYISTRAYLAPSVTAGK